MLKVSDFSVFSFTKVHLLSNIVSRGRFYVTKYEVSQLLLCGIVGTDPTYRESIRDKLSVKYSKLL